MVMIVKPSNETYNRFRKEFYRNKYGVGVSYTQEEFLEDKQDELEEGIVMNPENDTAVISDPLGIRAVNILSKYDQLEVAPQIVDWDLDLIKMFVLEHSGEYAPMKVGEGVYNMDNVLKILKVLEWPKKECFYYTTEDFPAIFYNNELIGLALAPMRDGDGNAPTYGEWVMKKGEEVSKMLEISRNPDLLQLRLRDSYLNDGKIVNVHRGDIEQIILTTSWGGSIYLAELKEGSQCGLTGRYSLEEDEVEQLREKFSLEVVDEREPRRFDANEIEQKVTQAWKQRDPTFQESLLYQECLDTVFDLAKYGAEPKDIGFYVKMYPYEPPETLEKYHHSMNTPYEWAKAIFDLIQRGIFTVKFAWNKTSYEYSNNYEDLMEVDDSDPRGSFTVYFKLNECDPIVRTLPESMKVEYAEYKAKHLAHYVTNVEPYSDSGWSGWKDRVNLEAFDLENVKA